jgi:hypothetical protein
MNISRRQAECRAKQVESLGLQVEVLAFRIELQDIDAVEAGLELSKIAGSLSDLSAMINPDGGAPIE